MGFRSVGLGLGFGSVPPIGSGGGAGWGQSSPTKDSQSGGGVWSAPPLLSDPPLKDNLEEGGGLANRQPQYKKGIGNVSRWEPLPPPPKKNLARKKKNRKPKMVYVVSNVMFREWKKTFQVANASEQVTPPSRCLLWNSGWPSILSRGPLVCCRLKNVGWEAFHLERRFESSWVAIYSGTTASLAVIQKETSLKTT